VDEVRRVHPYEYEALFEARERVVHLLSQWVVDRRTGLEFTKHASRALSACSFSIVPGVAQRPPRAA
jgi:hypothetical protein